MNEALKEVIYADEKTLMMQRRDFLKSQFALGPLGRADAFAAFDKMIANNRVARVLVFEVVDELARHNEWERAREYYLSTPQFTSSTKYAPSLAPLSVPALRRQTIRVTPTCAAWHSASTTMHHCGTRVTAPIFRLLLVRGIGGL